MMENIGTGRRVLAYSAAEIADELGDTARGDGGYGSTGR